MLGAFPKLKNIDLDPKGNRECKSSEHGSSVFPAPNCHEAEVKNRVLI